MSLNIIGDYPRARSNILEFIKRMAAIHPYITFILKENGNLIKYEKGAIKEYLFLPQFPHIQILSR